MTLLKPQLCFFHFSLLRFSMKAIALAGVLLAIGVGCGGGSQTASTSTSSPTAPAAAPADFYISFPSGGAVNVSQGSTQQITVEIDPVNSFSGTVDVAVSGLPAGVTVSPLSIPVSGSPATGVLQFSATTDASPATMNITVSATSGAISHKASMDRILK